MRWRFGYGIAALIALTAPVPAAHAQQQAQAGVSSDLTVVGKFYPSDGHSVLYVLTSKRDGKLPKGAVVGVEFENSGADYRYNGTYSRLQAIFLSADEWRKFVAIWKKARLGQDSKDDDYFSRKGDNYFDGQTELLVDPNHDGSISFTLGGNGHDERNVPKDLTIFDLQSKDVPEFDRSVKQVSAYFAK